MYAHILCESYCHTYINDKNGDRYISEHIHISTCTLYTMLHIDWYQNARKSQNKRSHNDNIEFYDFVFIEIK